MKCRRAITKRERERERERERKGLKYSGMRKVRMVLLPSRVKLKYNRSINRFSYPFF
jgi:hypothetical protein